MKALALLSGGLDSTLSIKMVLDQGIEVEALHFTTVFCRCNGADTSCGSHIKRLSDEFNIKIKTINNTTSMIESVKKPRHGYGSNMNPCIDCRINMLHSARQRMEEVNASFIVTGEVLKQRPMSQHLSALKLIEKETHLEGLILRPLSAKLLEPTIPEKNNWVDREKLLAISGRSRKEQMSLADLFEIKDYPCPAGGCLLTDPSFASRIKDLLVHNPDFTLNDVLLLQVGRHFRLNKDVKLVVGRNEKENQTISNLAHRDEDLLLEIADCNGPVSLIRGKFQIDEIKLAGGITARYADLPAEVFPPLAETKAGINDIKQEVKITILEGNILPSANLEGIISLTDSEIDKYRINN